MGTELHILNRGTEPTFLDPERQGAMNITIHTTHLTNSGTGEFLVEPPM